MSETIRQLMPAILAALGLIGTALVLTLAADNGWIDSDTAERLMGVVMGVVVAVSSNSLPKRLKPLSASCDPAREQSMRRFAGWALVLGGASYALAWLLIPIQWAAWVSISLLAASLLLVLVRLLWLRPSR